jgi:DNA-binding NtrC family response regulator
MPWGWPQTAMPMAQMPPGSPAWPWPQGMAMPMPMGMPPMGVPQADAPMKTISDTERELLVAALTTHRGRIPAVARALGVSRGTVYNKMRKFNLDPDSFR